MKSIVTFNHVGKSYRLKAGQSRSFRELFVARRVPPGNSIQPSGVFWALRDVTFDIHTGETVGLIGPNGAGKSTVLKLIGRILPPTSGRVEVQGRVAALLELGAGFHPDLTGRENVFLSGALAGISREGMQRKFPAIVDFSEIEAFIDMPVKHYSSGMFARLAFAVSIHLDPEILLVDEVLAVGDQNFQRKCLDRIRELQRRGVTIVLVSHAREVVQDYCSRALWLEQGRLMAEGMANAVVEQYLSSQSETEQQRLREEAWSFSGQHWGTRRVEITRVQILGAQGQEQTIFQTGDKMVVAIHYKTKEPVPPPVFGLAIHRNDGLHICGPNTGFSGVKLPPLDGIGYVTYTIPFLLLLDGLYHISVSSHNVGDTEMYDYHDRAYPFRILNRPSGPVRERYGFMTMQGVWTHEHSLSSLSST